VRTQQARRRDLEASRVICIVSVRSFQYATNNRSQQ
jgi:hypothetical protein